MKLTAKDLHWFALANTRPWPGFYAFKDRFLRRYGRQDGYDFQTIEHECWSCDGTGMWFRERCGRCNNGVYRTTEHWLERWALSGRIYHRPVNWWDVPLPRPVAVREFVGRVRHQEVSQEVARRAYMRLLLRHEPAAWWGCVVNEFRDSGRRLGWRWRMRLMRLRNALDLFPAVKDEEVPF